MGEALQSQIQCYLHHPNQEPDQQEQIAPECQTLKAHTSTENGDQGFAASFTIPIEKSMLDSLIRVLLTTSRYNFTVQNNCEEKLWSKVMLHFEQTPQQQFAFQGKCLDRESHLFEHSLQPKFFLGFPGHRSHQVPRHHQLSVTKSNPGIYIRMHRSSHRRNFFKYHPKSCHHFHIVQTATQQRRKCCPC